MTLRGSALLLLAAASCASPPRLIRATPGDFQPLDLGLEWTYEADGVTQIRRVTGVERVGRFECRVVEVRAGEGVERTWMRWDADGLNVYRVSDGVRSVDFDDPLPIILRKAAPGATWTFEERHGPIALSVEAKYEGEDELSVLK
ncbi:MAG TPA: hypothetical protein VJU16_02650, partial [Planctomycetota bacterium]|nr:hypothetical protein [Planctomycetota bacterium]